MSTGDFDMDAPRETEVVVSKPLLADRTTGLSSEDLLAIADHELGNLATLLHSLARRLSERWDRLSEDDRRNLATRLASQTVHLQLLLANLRTLRSNGHFGAGQRRTVADPARLLRSMIVDLETLAPEHELEAAVEENLPPVVLDVPRLQQVLLNVFANAARFTPQGSRIHTRVKAENGELIIEVEDQGTGVPVEQRDAVFEKYSRLGAHPSGSGLGLFVSRELLATEGGSIGLHEGPGGGCLVRIGLPIDGTDE